MSDWEREPLPVPLLRAPAAVAAGAFVVGVSLGAAAGPFVLSATEQPPRVVTMLLSIAVCAPFVLPTAWYRRHRLLWLWMAAAAAFVTLRAVFMAGVLLPYHSTGTWLLKTAMDGLAAAVLWTAALTVRAAIQDSR